MNRRYEVIVIGSGAGGGVIAGELADAGKRVLALESGPHRTAADFMRWEAHANHDIWWPLTMAEPPAPDQPPIPMFRGHCVGGTTTINTKVALRPTDQDYTKWHAAGGLLGEGGSPFAEPDLIEHIQRVERRLGVRERSDWRPAVKTVLRGFRAMGTELEPVTAYTDHSCMGCGSCLQGCPTNAGKNTMNAYIHPAWAERRLDLRPGCRVQRVVIEDRGGGPEAMGVEYTDGLGQQHVAGADVVVVCGGALATPQLLLRSGVREASGGSASSSLIGRHLGFHPARLVTGLFDEIQDAHMMYPISAHCMEFQRDENGGFVVEASTVQDPIGCSTALCDEHGVPLWGPELTEVMRKYRYLNALLTMVSDENHGVAWVDEDGRDRYSYEWSATEQERNRASLQFAREVLSASGGKRVLQTGLVTTHIQGGCRMGSDAERSVVDAHAELHDVRRLFVGDGSVVPRTLSVNPSLTIMSLASRLAAYLASGEHGYFRPAPAHATA